MESERGASGAREDMVAGMTVLGTDEVAVTEVLACASAIRPGLRLLGSWKRNLNGCCGWMSRIGEASL